jgi:hypothetical protein
MLAALRQSIDNEDVLFALSTDIYKSLLNFLLKAFSFEKQEIEKQSFGEKEGAQNELTQEAQRLVSKLLNSKEFTTSLVCLIQLLKTEAIPSNLNLVLSVQEVQYIRVLMRCISRITKALHSENPDLVRAFDVLVEMQKLFVKHPPENLSQDLPCLQDFDYIYRGLKDVSDKMVELQPEKCQSFLEFFAAEGEGDQDGESPLSKLRKSNAFIRYLSQLTQAQSSLQ